MNRSRGILRRGLAILAAAAGLWLAAGAARAEDGTAPGMLLVGNGNDLWLIRPNGPRAFDVGVHPVGQPWRLVGRDYPGAVEAAAAVDHHLHLILADPFAHLILHADGLPVAALEPQDDRWPAGARVLAAFEMADANGPAASALVVVVAGVEGRSASRSDSARAAGRVASTSGPSRRGPGRRPLPAWESAPATRFGQRPAAAPASAPAAGEGPLLQVFQYASGGWQHLAEFPCPPSVRRGKVLGAAADGRVYLYVDDEILGDQLFRWDGQDGNWARLGSLPIPLAQSATSATAASASSLPATSAGASRVFAMTAFGQQPVLLRAIPQPPPALWRLQLAAFEAKAGRFLVQDIRPVSGTPPWSTAEVALHPLRAARLGGQLALLWQRQDRLQMGTVDLNGQFVPRENVEVFQAGPPSGQGEEIRQYFIVGALIASAALALSLRGRPPLRPVRLPAGVVPADPLRRLLAGLIDLVPWFVLTAAVVPSPQITPDNVIQLIKESRVPNSAYIAALGAISLHVVYCVLMESRFGATLGKRLLKLRVTDDQGRPAAMAQLAQRNVMKIVELLWPPNVPVLLMMPVLNRNRQRLGDLFARTLVVMGLPRGEELPPDQTPPPE